MSTPSRSCCCCLGSGANYRVGYLHLNVPLCEPCADRMIACGHAEGTRSQSYDADGVGYLIWTCNDCGYRSIDDMS
jgi:hypothetical protein